MGICHHSQREITAQEPSELSHKVVVDSHIGVYVVDGHVARQGEQVSNPLYVLHRRPWRGGRLDFGMSLTLAGPVVQEIKAVRLHKLSILARIVPEQLAPI